MRIFYNVLKLIYIVNIINNLWTSSNKQEAMEIKIIVKYECGLSCSISWSLNR